MKKLGVTVVPLDLHARPIGSDDRALIRRAVIPSHAVANFQSFGLVGCHDGILPRESRSVPSSLGRNFCRRRQTCKKGARGDVSKQRPEIGDHDAREMAAKTAFLLASYQLRVSEVVETTWIETGCPPLSLSNESPVGARNGNFRCGDKATKSAILARISQCKRQSASNGCSACSLVVTGQDEITGT